MPRGRPATHGESVGYSKSAEVQAWANMKQRCYNDKIREYKHYGGRGITVCDRWLNDFKAFLSDLGRRPSRKHSLDRHPNKDGNYEPGNVRWANVKEQQRNKRNNVFIAALGESKTVAEWGEIWGVRQETILSRMKRGWPNGIAVSRPTRAWKRKVTV